MNLKKKKLVHHEKGLMTMMIKMVQKVVHPMHMKKTMKMIMHSKEHHHQMKKMAKKWRARHAKEKQCDHLQHAKVI
jgi:hypothetical protein